MFPASVLTTVNAPYSMKLDAETLAHCLKNPVAAKAAAGQMSAFFGEVSPELQKAFARAFHISDYAMLRRGHYVSSECTAPRRERRLSRGPAHFTPSSQSSTARR